MTLETVLRRDLDRALQQRDAYGRDLDNALTENDRLRDEVQRLLREKAEFDRAKKEKR